MFASSGGFDNHNGVSVASCLVLNQVRNLSEIRPGKIGDRERQGVCLTLAKPLCRNIWTVTELTDCIFDSASSAGGDVWEIIYYV